LRVIDVPFEPFETLEARVLARSSVVTQRSYDVYVAAMFPFHSIASSLGLPFVYYEHGVVDPVGIDARLRAMLVKIRADAQRHQLRARRVAVISRFLMHEQVNPAKHAETDVVYNGADSYGPAPASGEIARFRAALGIAPDDDVLAYIGRIERRTYKGVDELVEIAAAVRTRRPRMHLVLAGYGDPASREHYAALPGVIVRTNVPADAMPLHFASADVCASASRWEGFNLPLAEAQYYGRPVVAYDLAAHPEVVAPSGSLVPDASAFAEAVLGLLSDAAERERRAEAARAFAQQFTWANTAAALEACVRHAVRGQPS
jgi:1,2-diacylglycerol 3-alpha-glucosyltransferase